MEIPKHYSLHSEEDSHFVVHDKRDGKTFKVAKKGLHPAHQIKVMKLQKLAKGGEVDDTDGEDGLEEGVAPKALSMNSDTQDAMDFGVPSDSNYIKDSTEQPAASASDQIMASFDQSVGGNPLLGGQAPVQNSPMAPEVSPQVDQAPQPSPGEAPPEASNFPSSKELQGYVGQQVSGLKAEASAQQKQNEALAVQQQKNLDEEQKMFSMHQEKMQQFQQQYDKLSAEISSGKIDPDHYMHSRSTGQKISGAIALLLGGLSAGLTGGPNPAVQALNKHIENDIDAQKQNLGNKRSLLSENLRAQGNMDAAMNATRLQMAAMAQGKLQKVATETGNPIIQARAQQAASHILQGTIPIRAQLATSELQNTIRRDVLGRLQNQGQPGVRPVDMQDLSRAGLVDKATAEKESAAISKRQQAEAYAIDQVKKLDQEQSVFGGSFPYINPLNPESYKRADQYKAGVIQAIQNASPSKRLTPEVLAMQLEPFFTKTLDSGKTRQEGLKGILSLIRQHADPTPMASHYGVSGAIGGKNTISKDFKMGPVK